jgi:Cu/Ag efflux protein CusF
MTRPTALAAALLAGSLCLIVSTPAIAETVKARVIEVNERKNEAKVDVAGQTRTYRVDDRTIFRTLVPGRLAVITAELVNGRHTIVEARSAMQRGRIVRVEERQGSVTIMDNESRSTDTYYFEDDSARRLRVDDVIAFEVEDRPRRKVITYWNGGGGNRRDDRRGNTYTDSGRVANVDRRRNQVTIDVFSSRQAETFDVPDSRLLDTLRDGDRISFEYERRSNRLVIVAVR